MYMYKRGKVWWWEVQRDGRRSRGSFGTSSKEEAKKIAQRMKVVEQVDSRKVALQIVDALFPPEKVPGIGIDEAWGEYLRVAGATGRLAITKRTFETRRGTWGRFISWLKAKAPAVKNIEDVDGPLAARFAQCLAHDKGARGKVISEKSRRNIISELSTVWISLEKASGSIRNPWGGLTPKITKESRKEPFSAVQERLVMDAARKVGKDWYLACMIGRHTGLRYGDVATLEWKEVHFDKGYLLLKPNKTRRFKVEVCIPMVPELKDALLEAEKGRKGDFVLPLHAELYGNRSKSAYDTLNFREVLNLAGITGEEYTFHSWRHTLRSRLADSGASMETAKRLLGHSSDEMSLRYDHSAHVDESLAALMAAR